MWESEKIRSDLHLDVFLGASSRRPSEIRNSVHPGSEVSSRRETTTSPTRRETPFLYVDRHDYRNGRVEETEKKRANATTVYETSREQIWWNLLAPRNDLHTPMGRT